MPKNKNSNNPKDTQKIQKTQKQELSWRLAGRTGGWPWSGLPMAAGRHGRPAGRQPVSLTKQEKVEERTFPARSRHNNFPEG